MIGLLRLLMAASVAALLRRGLGVGLATAIRWRQMALAHGRAVAGKPGGDQRSSKTEVHAVLIMAMLDENGDITLTEIQTGLAKRGVSVGIGTL